LKLSLLRQEESLKAPSAARAERAAQPAVQQPTPEVSFPEAVVAAVALRRGPRVLVRRAGPVRAASDPRRSRERPLQEEGSEPAAVVFAQAEFQVFSQGEESLREREARRARVFRFGDQRRSRPSQD